MGCTASKLGNEDTVRRCKERRRLMKDAVIARHHLSAAHSDYLLSLKSTGSALSSFSSNLPLHVSDQTPSILIPTHSPTPPLIPPSPSLQTSKTSKLAPSTTRSLNNHQRRNKPTVKLPHILSESSEASYSPRQYPQNSYSYKHNNNNYTYNAETNYASTPSQASSVWNWENFYPPSPPHFDTEDDKSSLYSSKDSIFFSTHKQKPKPNSTHNLEKTEYEKTEYEGTETEDNDKSSLYSSKASIFSSTHKQKPKTEYEETETEDNNEREEVQCSEWDHYSTTSTTTDEEIDNESRSEMSRSNCGSSVYNESVSRAGTTMYSSVSKTKVGRYEEGGAMSEDGEAMRMVVRHKDLTEIVSSIKEYFDKAADSGQQVSEMLETGRAQLDRSFRQLKKTVYHSSGMLSNLSSSWTSKPPLAIKYKFEPGSIGEPSGSKSLCSTLDRLLAWEMKLYQEVKAREGVKIEHEKKLSALQSQEYKGEDESKLNKTKASIKRLQSLIVVTSQAVSTTSTAIVGLRDSELVPQLIELCHGLMYMWRSMNQCHEVQNQVVQQVRGLVNRSTKGESTSDLHRQATRDLEAAVSSWHTSFCRLIKFQRDFIRSLQGWFKLTLLPINTEEANINGSQPSDVYIVFDEWKLALDRVPDTVASESIKSFINVVHSISLKQAEEMKVKKRTESASKELEKKASSLRSIEKKYYHSYSMVGLGLPGSGQDDGHGLDARDPLSEKKTELVACQRRVEDEMVRHSKAVEVTRSMTLNNIQTGLPGVFQAMTSFSGLIMEALEVVCNKSYEVK